MPTQIQFCISRGLIVKESVFFSFFESEASKKLQYICFSFFHLRWWILKRHWKQLNENGTFCSKNPAFSIETKAQIRVHSSLDRKTKHSYLFLHFLLCQHSKRIWQVFSHQKSRWSRKIHIKFQKPLDSGFKTNHTLSTTLQAELRCLVCHNWFDKWNSLYKFVMVCRK